MEKEIQELNKKSKDNQGERQPLQKMPFSWQLEPASEEQPQQMGQPQGNYKDLKDTVTNGESELKEPWPLAEKNQQHRGE